MSFEDNMWYKTEIVKDICENFNKIKKKIQTLEKHEMIIIRFRLVKFCTVSNRTHNWYKSYKFSALYSAIAIILS